MKWNVKLYRYIGEGEGDKDKTFTQDQVNTMLAENKRGMQDQLTQLKTDFETISKQNLTLQETAKLSDDQMTEHQTQSEEMRQRGLSDQQKFSEQLASLQNTNKDLTRQKTEAENNWRGKYHNELVENALASACVANDQHHGVQNPEHIVSLLAGRTVVDEDGKILVKDFEVTGEDGKPLKKDVSPAEAVNVYSQLESHKNLFNVKGKTGSGDESNSSKSKEKHNLDTGPSDPDSMKGMKEWLKS